MSRKCIKCQFVNPSATGSDTESCPQCGAIYSKVEAALEARRRGVQAPVTRLPPDSDRAPFAAAPVFPMKSDSQVDFELYVERMRAGSLYPTFRALTTLMHWLLLAVAGIAVLGGLAALLLGPSGGWSNRIGAFLGCLFFALMVFIFARVVKEASLMLADLSDAAVRLASGK